jgi:hypothetical protein
MFNLFKRRNGQPKLTQISDLDNNPLAEGDIVDCLRYDMGKSKLILEGTEWIYESIDTGQRVSYVKMIDAITSNQKVRKITYQ